MESRAHQEAKELRELVSPQLVNVGEYSFHRIAHLFPRLNHVLDFLPLLLVNHSEYVVFVLGWDAERAVYLLEVLREDHDSNARVLEHNWILEVLQVVQERYLLWVVWVGRVSDF